MSEAIPMVVAAIGARHQQTAPPWTLCQACGQPYPCEAAVREA